MTGLCLHCGGRGRTQTPLFVYQRLQANDAPLRMLLHEHCVGPYTRAHPTEFIRSDAASDSLRFEPEIQVPIGIAPGCEACDELSACGIFIHSLGDGKERAAFFCAVCGFRVAPSSCKRLLALFAHGDAGEKELEPSGLRDLMERLNLGIEMAVPVAKLRSTIATFAHRR